ncbi:MAG: hypothetical protein ACM3S4_04875 [Burkholderiales bacterium]
MINFFSKNKSAGITLPKSKTVHGIEVKKVPVGKYLSAIRELEELPAAIISDLFPSKKFGDIMAELVELTDESLIRIATRLLVIAPEYVVNALAIIIDVDKDLIKNTLTPKELCDVVKTYWELNDMTDFFGTVSGLIKAKLPTLISGSNVGSPSPKALG